MSKQAESLPEAPFVPQNTRPGLTKDLLGVCSMTRSHWHRCGGVGWEWRWGRLLREVLTNVESGTGEIGDFLSSGS